MKAFLAAAAALILATPAYAELPFVKERAEWSVPQKPFHIIGNIYYVGMAGVSAFPMRVKCATLAWHTMKSALEGGAAVASV